MSRVLGKFGRDSLVSQTCGFSLLLVRVKSESLAARVLRKLGRDSMVSQTGGF